MILITFAGAGAVGAGYFAQPLPAAYLQLSAFAPHIVSRLQPPLRITFQALYCFFPLFIIATGLRLAAAQRAKKPVSRARQKSRAPGEFTKRVLLPAFLAMLPVAVLIFVFYLVFDRQTNRLLHINYYAMQRNWPQVLRQARRFPDRPYSISSVFDINRALYYTGRLGEEMFMYPQSPRGLLLTVPRQASTANFKRCELLTELGYPNVAARFGYEVLAVYGRFPLILRQLALTNIVLGRTEVAVVFLRALSRDLIYGGEARKLLTRLQHEPRMLSDKETQQLRARMCSEDILRFGTDMAGALELVVETDGNNRMAFEYLMAHYLLTGKIKAFAENIPRPEDYGYTGLCRHYEEALAIYLSSGGQEQELGGWVPSEEARRRVDMFEKTYRAVAARSGRTAAQEVLQQQFGGSYMYYFAFPRWKGNSTSE